MIVWVRAGSEEVVVVPVVVAPVVVVPAVRVAAATHFACCEGKLASASSVFMLSRQLVRCVRISAVVPPSTRQAARALAQLIALALADLLSAEVAAESCLYSVLLRDALVAAAIAERGVPTTTAPPSAASVMRIRRARRIDRA